MKQSMKNKYINPIIITILLIFFGISFAKEYFSFHSESNSQIEQNTQTKTNLSNFSFDQIREIQNIELFKNPDKNLLKTLVKKIDEAKKRIYIEIYIFTEKDLRAALIRAKKK